MWCTDGIRNVECISHVQISGKILKNTIVFKKPIPPVLQVSAASPANKSKKDILLVKEKHFWPCLNRFIIKNKHAINIINRRTKIQY